MKTINLFLICSLSLAKGIRTIHTDDKKMNVLRLRIGQSTILRFQERPKRAVIGNKNYYNIEFIENSNDITIQPLATVGTNLFIYTEKNKTYGFYLRTKRNSFYDDLVNVYQKDHPRVFRSRAKILIPVKSK